MVSPIALKQRVVGFEPGFALRVRNLSESERENLYKFAKQFNYVCEIPIDSHTHWPQVETTAHAGPVRIEN